jgi:hypothetical protein
MHQRMKLLHSWMQQQLGWLHLLHYVGQLLRL